MSSHDRMSCAEKTKFPQSSSGKMMSVLFVNWPRWMLLYGMLHTQTRVTKSLSLKINYDFSCLSFFQLETSSKEDVKLHSNLLNRSPSPPIKSVFEFRWIFCEFLRYIFPIEFERTFQCERHLLIWIFKNIFHLLRRQLSSSWMTQSEMECWNGSRINQITDWKSNDSEEMR